VVSDIGVDAVKVGMLGSAETIAAVRAALDLVPGAPVVLDPVMVSETGAQLLAPDARRALVALLPRATVMTPNLLEARALHPGRSARDHLRWMAASNGIPAARVDDVLDLVGLGEVAGTRVGKFSLGMGQRLGIAVALLGNPPVVVLDEPVNGLDPEGIRWVRTLARDLATQGRTVFISSHLMSEMALTADHLVVVGRGRILADCSMPDFIAEHAASYVRVASPQQGAVADLLRRQGLEVAVHDGALHVQGLDAAAIGELVGTNGLLLHELTLVRSSLEEAFMTLTADSVDYHAATPAGIAR